jgi:hypothetical protein
MAIELDLREAPPALHEQIREGFLNGDAGTFVD